DERSRASLSCPWKEAWTKSATIYPSAEAAAPDQSTRPCSDAANQYDPSTHGFRDCNPWQGGGASVSILILIAAPKKGVGNYSYQIRCEAAAKAVPNSNARGRVMSATARPAPPAGHSSPASAQKPNAITGHAKVVYSQKAGPSMALGGR